MRSIVASLIEVDRGKAMLYGKFPVRSSIHAPATYKRGRASTIRFSKACRILRALFCVVLSFYDLPYDQADTPNCYDSRPTRGNRCKTRYTANRQKCDRIEHRLMCIRYSPNSKNRNTTATVINAKLFLLDTRFAAFKKAGRSPLDLRPITD